jgi:two-component system, NtrC family, response regulator
MNSRLLIVDDDEGIRSQMKWALTDLYDVTLAEDRPSALAACKATNPAVALLDLGLPPNPGGTEEGMATLRGILELNSGTKVIVITGQAEHDNALKAVEAGAYDFLAKPVEMDELKIILKRAFHLSSLETENRAMQQRLRSEGFEGMLGTSPAVQGVFESIRKVAATEAPVLILGESGTGKEMTAVAVHRNSLRKDGPFVAINCGAIPEALLESELFGHERGAFTGAHAQRKGRVELAVGGTLFLDEVGELTPPLQVKLLRFLQEKQIERVGGRASIPVDVRVIAATNIDLSKTIQDGSFREDLYYRLAVVVLRMPSLRARPEDIPLLAQAFLNRHNNGSGKEPPKLGDDALRAIQQHAWPGNIRELENRIKRAAIMANGRRITAADLELVNLTAPPSRSLREARETVERELIEQSLKRNKGKISRAAIELGVSRPTLYELIEKLGIKNE